MVKALIIVGHQNIKYNSIFGLHGNTGTAGELQININVGNMVSGMLRERGITVVQSDGNVNDDKSITSQDFNLALALHCDMDVSGDQGGGMCGSGDSSVDNSWQESLRIKKVFDATYFSEVQIVNRNFVTAGMAKYYVWQYLSDKTPCVLLEMGQAMDSHDKVLLANTKLIATGIVKSVCKALNVSYEINPPTTSNPTTLETENKALKAENESLKIAITKAKTDSESKLADKEKECQDKILSYKNKIVTYANNLII